MAFQQLRDEFATTVRGWPKRVVLYLAETGDFWRVLDGLAEEAGQLASVWARAEKARRAAGDPDRGAAAAGGVYRRAWRGLSRQHVSGMTAFQKREWVRLIQDAGWLNDRDRQRLEAIKDPDEEAVLSQLARIGESAGKAD
jgi:hypothetical protein